MPRALPDLPALRVQREGPELLVKQAPLVEQVLRVRPDLLGPLEHREPQGLREQRVLPGPLV